MLKKTKAQGLSITTIVVAVIALIVIVVIIAILTGKMGAFSAGLGSAASCENACKAMARDKFDDEKDSDECKDAKGLHIPGNYGDVTGENAVCCCEPKSASVAQSCEDKCNNDFEGCKVTCGIDPDCLVGCVDTLNDCVDTC